MKEWIKVFKKYSNAYNITIHHIKFELHLHLPIAILYTMHRWVPFFSW